MMKVESHSVYVGQFCILDVGKCMRVFYLFFLFVCWDVFMEVCPLVLIFFFRFICPKYFLDTLIYMYIFSIYRYKISIYTTHQFVIISNSHNIPGRL